MSSNIGKLMVDMFMESAQYIEVSSPHGTLRSVVRTVH